MRSLILCVLFLPLAGTLAAWQEPPPLPPPPPANSEWIEFDPAYTWIAEDDNGNFVLWNACAAQGVKDKNYYVIMYAEDKFGGVYYFGPRGGGGEKWQWGANYDGSEKWNDFTLTLVKDSAYWQEVNNHGVSNVYCKLIEQPDATTFHLRASDQSKMFLPPR